MDLDMHTRTELENDIRTTQSGIDLLKVDIESAEVPESFKIGFDSFVRDFTEWKDAIGFWSRMSDSTWHIAREYAQRLNDWIHKFKNLGGETYAEPPPQRNKVEPAKAGFSIPWWVWLFGGGLLIWKLSPLRTAERVKVLTSPKSGFKK